MLSWFIMLCFACAIVIQYLFNKPTIMAMLTALLLVPRVSVMGSRFDGLYFVLIVLGGAIIIKDKGKVIYLPREFKNYTLLLVGLHLLYLFSWLVFNRNGVGSYALSVIGSMKLILFMWELLQSNKNVPDVDFDKEIANFLLIVTVINTIVVGWAMLDGSNVARFLANVYYSSKEAEQLYGEYLVNGHINRFAGLFAYPMHLGLFASFALAYAIGHVFNKKYMYRVVTIAFLSLVLGFSSCSKSFILGAVIVFISYVLLSCRSSVVSIYTFALLFAMVIGIICLFVFYSSIYSFIYKYAGENYAYYFSFLKNWKDIFYGRSIVLARTMEVIKKYWFLGVGVDTLLGEANMDNAYVMILHNGGVVALSGVLAFYYNLYYKLRNHIEACMLLIIMFAMGMGFQTLFATDTSFWVLIILMWKATFGENEFKANVNAL